MQTGKPTPDCSDRTSLVSSSLADRSSDVQLSYRVGTASSRLSQKNKATAPVIGAAALSDIFKYTRLSDSLTYALLRQPSRNIINQRSSPDIALDQVAV